MFAQAVGALPRRMCVIAVEGVAVTDNASRRVVARNGQCIAQAGGDGLTYTARN